MAIQIITVTGTGMIPFLRPLETLRIEVFRAWPYLYDGSPKTEGEFNPRAPAEDAAFVVALDDGLPVGMATCGPLTAETAAFQAPFIAAGLDPAEFCYFGESVLRPAYRGQGIGVAFFAAREAQARKAGFSFAAFCSVRRALHDPRRPPDAAPLDGFWRKRGYAPLPGVACAMTWPEIGNPSPVANLLDVWTRRL